MACATMTYKRLLDEVVSGKLATSGWEQLRGHLAVCQECRKQYNRAVYVERLLAGGRPALALPAPGELCRIGDAVLAQLGRPERASAWSWNLWRWLIPVTTC